MRDVGCGKPKVLGILDVICKRMNKQVQLVAHLEEGPILMLEVRIERCAVVAHVVEALRLLYVRQLLFRPVFLRLLIFILVLVALNPSLLLLLHLRLDLRPSLQLLLEPLRRLQVLNDQGRLLLRHPLLEILQGLRLGPPLIGHTLKALLLGRQREGLVARGNKRIRHVQWIALLPRNVPRPRLWRVVNLLDLLTLRRRLGGLRLLLLLLGLDASSIPLLSLHFLLLRIRLLLHFLLHILILLLLRLFFLGILLHFYL
mmetsp:Transcript_77021/g.165039  ORF Transcript_77021/g.165039 Transcript_77021/m.165039 type:complete len:258 (+) Transcript_77021:913-1686(+)